MTYKIYVPVDNLSDYACYVISSGDVIRAYETKPQSNSTVNYVDFYINSHYMQKPGTQTFNQYYNVPDCIDSANLTNVYSYRNDFADICIIAIILIGVVWFLVSKLIKTLFKGRKIF